MKTSKLLVGTLAAALTVGGLFVFNARAVERARNAGHFNGQLLEKAKEKLGLTDEQISKIKDELKSEKDGIKTLASRLHEARKGLRDAIHASDATETSVRAASAKVAAVEADVSVERMKLNGRIGPILTGDQKEKIKAFEVRIDDLVDSLINRIGEQ